MQQTKQTLFIYLRKKRKRTTQKQKISTSYTQIKAFPKKDLGQ